jgi:hypothetical protein
VECFAGKQTGRETVPQIIVTADADGPGEAVVMLRERVTLSDFESGHFAQHLVERLGWAVEDADAFQRQLTAQSAETDRATAVSN